MTDLNQAREWAESVGNIEGLMPGTRATVEVIQSLPDQWVDVEEVRKVTDRHNDLIVDFLDQIEGDIHTDTWEAIRDFMCELNVEVDTLAIPKLPTLADMTEEEREACRWMQAKVKGSDGLKIINTSGEDYTELLRERGGSCIASNHEVTPLPDLPKLQWPGSGGAPTIAQKERVADDQAVAKDVCNNPRPENVPDNEIWLVEFRGNEWIGKRNRGGASNADTYPWRIASVNGEGIDIVADSDITLIHKLVPETHTLPKGMRLADHKEYGRVVVSPKDDLDGDYRVFCPQDNTEYGANWWYAHKSDLTFLGGDQHV